MPSSESGDGETVDARCGFKYPSRFMCNRLKSAHAKMKHKWEPIVLPWRLRSDRR